MAGNNIIFITVDKERISPLATSEKLVVYDMDSRRIIAEIPSPRNDVDTLEELLEEYDASILVTSGIADEKVFAVEEAGVRVYVVKPVRFKEFIESI
ncbi:MAG: NifB/NifX family molybdenum-iron cluster-binding protein [Thermosphaera sp.]